MELKLSCSDRISHLLYVPQGQQCSTHAKPTTLEWLEWDSKESMYNLKGSPRNPIFGRPLTLHRLGNVFDDDVRFLGRDPRNRDIIKVNSDGDHKEADQDLSEDGRSIWIHSLNR